MWLRQCFNQAMDPNSVIFLLAASESDAALCATKAAGRNQVKNT
jgi:hypothetical protein